MIFLIINCIRILAKVQNVMDKENYGSVKPFIELLYIYQEINNTIQDYCDFFEEDFYGFIEIIKKGKKNDELIHELKEHWDKHKDTIEEKRRVFIQDVDLACDAIKKRLEWFNCEYQYLLGDNNNMIMPLYFFFEEFLSNLDISATLTTCRFFNVALVSNEKDHENFKQKINLETELEWKYLNAISCWKFELCKLFNSIKNQMIDNYLSFYIDFNIYHKIHYDRDNSIEKLIELSNNLKMTDFFDKNDEACSFVTKIINSLIIICTTSKKNHEILTEEICKFSPIEENLDQLSNQSMIQNNYNIDIGSGLNENYIPNEFSKKTKECDYQIFINNFFNLNKIFDVKKTCFSKINSADINLVSNFSEFESADFNSIAHIFKLINGEREFSNNYDELILKINYELQNNYNLEHSTEKKISFLTKLILDQLSSYYKKQLEISKNSLDRSLNYFSDFTSDIELFFFNKNSTNITNNPQISITYENILKNAINQLNRTIELFIETNTQTLETTEPIDIDSFFLNANKFRNDIQKLCEKIVVMLSEDKFYVSISFIQEFKEIYKRFKVFDGTVLIQIYDKIKNSITEFNHDEDYLQKLIKSFALMKHLIYIDIFLIYDFYESLNFFNNNEQSIFTKNNEDNRVTDQISCGNNEILFMKKTDLENQINNMNKQIDQQSKEMEMNLSIEFIENLIMSIPILIKDIETVIYHTIELDKNSNSKTNCDQNDSKTSNVLSNANNNIADIESDTKRFNNENPFHIVENQELEEQNSNFLDQNTSKVIDSQDNKNFNEIETIMNEISDLSIGVTEILDSNITNNPKKEQLKILDSSNIVVDDQNLSNSSMYITNDLNIASTCFQSDNNENIINQPEKFSYSEKETELLDLDSKKITEDKNEENEFISGLNDSISINEEVDLIYGLTGSFELNDEKIDFVSPNCQDDARKNSFMQKNDVLKNKKMDKSNPSLTYSKTEEKDAEKTSKISLTMITTFVSLTAVFFGVLFSIVIRKNI